MKFQGHITVLKNETVNGVAQNAVDSKNTYFIDMTFGGGGHCFELLRVSECSSILGLDQDPDALESGDTIRFGELMHEHWEHKKKRSGGMSNPMIDKWYQLAMDNGAIGGKLVGAGGGGFLMFMANDREKLRNAMKSIELEEVRFGFDFEGTKIMMNS